ncbi:SRPBCC family protein [Arthrobacter sp. PsM3]|uniref:SRPBCC family protein n=1 Tax=Arthrobacter sp. PsM3 TaxID=3030531 RepID=UPI00263AD6BD|nr:SRPBCC family protein [Arthrobacter sp. PsM3]MDN4645511.1 SRPBCC family protein [Arthrobacter sp. PsM3]
MTSIQGEIVIGRPLSEVFDFVADERNEPRYNPRILHVEKVTGGSMRNGTQFKVTTKSRGRPLTMLLKTTEYQRPTRLANTTSMSSATIRGVLTFEPAAGGTLLRWSWDIQPRGALKFLSPIIGRIGKRQEAANWASLKRYLESLPAAETPGSGPALT